MDEQRKSDGSVDYVETYLRPWISSRNETYSFRTVEHARKRLAKARAYIFKWEAPSRDSGSQAN